MHLWLSVIRRAFCNVAVHLHRAVANGEASGARPPHLRSVPPISRLAPGCYIHPTLYFKNVPPLLVFGPPAAKSWRRACTCICGALFVKILYLANLAQKLLSLRIFSYLCVHLAISAQR